MQAKARRRIAQPKPPNLSREVFALLKQQGECVPGGADSGLAGPSNLLLPAMMPSALSAGTAGGFKGGPRGRGAAAPKVKWTWAAYSNSARGGDAQLFYRWNKAGIEFQDYPYARFNVHMAKLDYTDGEYAQVVAPLDPGGGWTRAQDDALCRLAQTYACRWPVVHDRWVTLAHAPPGGAAAAATASGTSSAGASLPPRRAVDLQHRYCTVAQALLLARKRKYLADAQQQQQQQQAAAQHAVAQAGGEQAASLQASAQAGPGLVAGPDPAAAAALKLEDQARALGVGLELKYDKSLEAERRALLEAAWQRSRPDDKTEAQLKDDLKQVGGRNASQATASK
jgi:DNA methyltransferase 1-associated protein 1